MSPTTEFKQQLGKIRRQLITSLALSALLPLVAYAVLRPVVANDTTTLAIVGIIPVVWTVLLWIVRRQADWISILAVLGFAVAVAISYLTGGSPLALELRGSVWTGLLGITFLIAAISGKPLLLLFIHIFARRNPELAKALQTRLSDPARRRRLTRLTALVGCVLLAKTVIDIVLALTLPVETFLSVSRLVTWTLLGGGAALVWWIRQGSRRFGDAPHEN